MELFDATLFITAAHGNIPQRVQSTCDTPLPTEFDFNNPEECARKICAVMLNVAGTGIAFNCRVRFNEVANQAYITDDVSFAVMYLPPRPRPMSQAEIEATAAHAVDMWLGHCACGWEVPGWDKAVWSV